MKRIIGWFRPKVTPADVVATAEHRLTKFRHDIEQVVTEYHLSLPAHVAMARIERIVNEINSHQARA